MNISVINGYDLKLSRSEELEAQVLAFKKKGGKVKEMTCAYKPKEASKPKVEGEKKESKPKKTKGKNSKKSQHNEIQQFEASKRKLKQQAVLKEYIEWAKGNYWSAIAKKCNGEVKNGQLSMILTGISSIKNDKQWDLVVNAISELRKENENKKG